MSGNGDVPVLLSRESILGADDIRMELVHCPEWGGSVYVRTMTGNERDRFEFAMKGSGRETIRANLAAQTMCGADRRLLFTPEDVEALGEKCSSALDRVVEAVLRVNKIKDEDIDELEKN